MDGAGDNNLGVAGVNWNAKVMALKFLDAGGSGVRMPFDSPPLDPATIDSVKVRVPNAYQAMISAPIDPSSRSTGFASAGFQI